MSGMEPTDERRAQVILTVMSADLDGVKPWEDLDAVQIDALTKIARAIRASDEAAGMVLVNRDMIQQAHALLAQIMSAGHNALGPTPEDMQGTFWRLDNVLAAATESDNG